MVIKTYEFSKEIELVPCLQQALPNDLNLIGDDRQDFKGDPVELIERHPTSTIT